MPNIALEVKQEDGKWLRVETLTGPHTLDLCEYLGKRLGASVTWRGWSTSLQTVMIEENTNPKLRANAKARPQLIYQIPEAA